MKEIAREFGIPFNTTSKILNHRESMTMKVGLSIRKDFRTVSLKMRMNGLNSVEIKTFLYQDRFYKKIPLSMPFVCLINCFVLLPHLPFSMCK